MTTNSSQARPTTRHVGAMTSTVKSDLEIVLRRVIDAPRQRVFEAFTRCEHIRRWWRLRNSTMTSCDMDFRPGGTWRYVTREQDGAEYAFRGEYREIVPPERIVQTFEFEGMPGAVSIDSMTLLEEDGRTTLISTSTFDSIEARDGMLQAGMETGAAETYDRLEEFVKTMAMPDQD